MLFMQSGIDVNPKELAQRAESLIRNSSHRYLTTVKIAFRAKQRRFDDFDGLLDDSMIKPVQRAIIEMSDEQDQPDLLPGLFGGCRFKKVRGGGGWLIQPATPFQYW